MAETIATVSFDRLDQAAQDGGTTAVLEQLIQLLREHKRFHELFEALKMQLRHRLGLPLLFNDSADVLSPAVRQKLEDGLLEACRQVGLAFLEDGQIRESWMYLRVTDDRQLVRDRLRALPASEENLDALVELLLQEGLDVGRGYQLVLEHYGTCNAITTFDSALYGRPRKDRQMAAGLLVRHVYRELADAVRSHIRRREGADVPEGMSLNQLLDNRDWLFEGGTYHLDATHLASTVRIARILSEPHLVRMAWELTEYGRRLDRGLQYPGDEPFADLYLSYGLFYQAVLGTNVESALGYFREKAERSDVYHEGSATVEAYIDLLVRTGRSDEAIAATLRWLPPGTPTRGDAPTLIELCERAGNYEPLLSISRQRGEPLGYAMGLMRAAAGLDEGERGPS